MSDWEGMDDRRIDPLDPYSQSIINTVMILRRAVEICGRSLQPYIPILSLQSSVAASYVYYAALFRLTEK
jgi:hypothetical protein